MRHVLRRSVPLLLTSLAVPAAGAFTATASARTPEPPDACAQALDRGERETYRFKDGRRTWSTGRVVVTPTRADAHRYCIEVRLGGRAVFHQSSTKGWARQGGRWVVIGGDGGGGDLVRSYTRTAQIQARRRVEFRYDVRIQGRWYRASFRVQNL
ncbi:hypothetical protein [Patulibacter minatonensis]|uniref:hypothetical protein n=1 Tax=Patulibacter minatonensis TaxID=298163 RepID=UPI00047C759D|nr:hypothetical protein [Patulibacter minatonensis]